MAPGPPNLGDNRFALLASGPQSKRKKPTYTPINFPDLPQLKKENPKFLTIRAADANKPISKYSCSAVHKALESISKEIISISELRDGNLLLLVKNSQIAQKFISAKKLIGVCDIEVNYHENLNSSKGTIFAPCLNNVDEKEIIENMSAQGVTDVYKFSKLENNVSQYTGTVLLTFNLFKLPEKVEVSWRIAKVNPYYPNPMRCKTCQLLGHTAKRCNKAPSCQSCNFPPHPPPCSRIYCANCAGDHPSSSKSCPKYMQSKEILKIKCQNKCSMREALKLDKEQTPTTLSASFAAVVTEFQNLSKIEQSKTKPPAALAPSPSSKSPSTASLNAHSDTLIQPSSTSSNTTTENNKNPQISNSQSSIDSLSIPSGTSFQINSNLSNPVSENNNDHVSKTMPSFVPNELYFNSHPQFSPHTPLLLDSTLSHILTQAQSIQTAYVPQTHTSQPSNSSAINKILSQTQFDANNIHDQSMSDNDQTMSHSDPQYM